MRALALYLVLGFLSGCGPGAAQRALSAQASIIVATRPARIEAYESLHGVCLGMPTEAQYERCMAPAVHVARAADSYRETLLATQAAIAAGDDEGSLLPCVVESAKHLIEALTAANVPVPREVQDISAFVPEGLCQN